MRSRAWLLIAVAAIAVQVFPMLQPVSAQSGPGIVISELRFRGPAGSSDEFIELFNAGSRDVNIGEWTVWGSDNQSPPTFLIRAQIPPNTVVKPGCYYLLTGPGYVGSVIGDRAFSPSHPDNAGVAVITAGGAFADRVGFGTSAAAYGEGRRLPPLTQIGFSYERKPGGADGHADTNDNFNDFQLISPARPQNSASACLEVKSEWPHDVQGAGATSPRTGQTVTVRGVVTARTSDGFFIQTEPGSEDLDPNTSEGLFIAAATTVAVGRVVKVKGNIEEFADLPGSATVTRLSNVTEVTDLGAAAPPAPFVLSDAELSAAGASDQLERFEGMRIAASLRSVSGTGADGSFYAVLVDAARPFREAGIEAGSPALACASGPCVFESFDGNPERLRVDSDGVQGTSAVHLSTNAVMNGVAGPLHYAMRAYTLLPESTLVPIGGMIMTAAPAAGADQFSIASLNLGDPTAVAHETRLAKASLMMRAMLTLPDIIGVQEAENASVLSALAARIDDDGVADGEPAPGYAAQLGGFLVKAARVAVVSVEPVGADATFTDPAGRLDEPLFDRPPVMLRAVVSGGPLVLPQHVTVLNNQFRSLDDSGRNDVVGRRARAQRHAQAEWIANFVQNRQLNDPSEALVLLGNFNAHAFNDGYVDTMGTVSGAPAPADQVVLASPDLVSPDLANLAAFIAGAPPYSSVADGHAQSLDHVLATENLVSQLRGFSYARVNADFPDALRALANNPGRLSDRDPMAAYFSFPPDVNAPVFGDAPDQAAEASGPDGAAVNFPLPAATDNLDTSVVVTCVPASGNVFPIGHTGVVCSAQDAAGNAAQASFTVSVQDTTAPVLVVPPDISEEADSPGGRVITFATSASDAVSGSVGVSCVPASGSTFPIGTTAVDCSAADAAGNAGSARFNVTVIRPIPGRMHGGGAVVAGLQRVVFDFDIAESANFVERGWLMVLAKDGAGRPRHFAAMVAHVRFSNAAGYSPGVSPASGVDTATFSGVGSWNGLPNYRFVVTASDRGEPGVGRDSFSLVVTSPTGHVVESISGVLRGGNVQALRD